MSIKSIKLESSGLRFVLILVGIILLVFTYFFAKWNLANSASTRTDDKRVAEFTTELAPSDPQTHYAAAVLLEKTFLPEDFAKSLEEYEKATALAPNSYHLWLALGKARERNGDAVGAEKALRKALELAPNYSQVQWSLGNNLLRQGKAAEAYAEIRKAVDGDPVFANPAVATAWQIFEGDITQIKQVVGDSVQTKSALAIFLTKEKRFDEAFEIWNSLPDDAKKTAFKANSEELYNQLLAAKKYRSALKVLSQISAERTSKIEIGRVANGGFEDGFDLQNTNIFDWQTSEGAHPQIGLNNEHKHGGGFSLFMIFNSPDGKQFRNVSQTIVVESGKKYAFEMFYRAELKTSATLRWEIVDAADGKILAATETLATNADWTSQKSEFVASEITEAVTIRLVRGVCGSQICPISGKVWFDDLTLKSSN